MRRRDRRQIIALLLAAVAIGAVLYLFREQGIPLALALMFALAAWLWFAIDNR